MDLGRAGTPKDGGGQWRDRNLERLALPLTRFRVRSSRPMALGEGALRACLFVPKTRVNHQEGRKGTLQTLIG